MATAVMSENQLVLYKSITVNPSLSVIVKTGMAPSQADIYISSLTSQLRKAKKVKARRGQIKFERAVDLLEL